MLSQMNNDKRPSLYHTALEHGTMKYPCLTNETYCFKDSDCVKICTENDVFECDRGVCSLPNVDLLSSAQNDIKCDEKMGMVGFLLGDTAFGRFQKICKSIDPGISISNQINLMCKSENININYLNRYPMASDCTNCDKKITIPATSMKREHVECNNPFYDMIRY